MSKSKENSARRPLKDRSHNSRILGYLSHGKSLTPMSALRLFDCFALSSRIAELKKRGHNIRSEMITLSHGKRVAQYTLKRA